MSKNTNIAIVSGTVVALGVIYLIYTRDKNEKEVKALLNFIDASYTEVNQSKAGDEAIKNISNIKLDLNKIHIGNLYGKYTNPAIRDAVAKVVTELWASMKGGGTDTALFISIFSKIRNKNTMRLVNDVYNAVHKESLFKAMMGEHTLYNSQYAFYNDNNTIWQSIPFINGHWFPSISKFLQNLPDYL